MSPLLPIQNTAIMAASVGHMGVHKIATCEALDLCSRVNAVQLACYAPGSLELASTMAEHQHLLADTPTESLDVVSQVSLLKSMMRMRLMPPRELLMASEPHWVATNLAACSPCEVQALAGLPALLMRFHYSPGRSLVASLCAAILCCDMPVQAKVCWQMCMRLSNPVETIGLPCVLVCGSGRCRVSNQAARGHTCNGGASLAHSPSSIYDLHIQQRRLP